MSDPVEAHSKTTSETEVVENSAVLHRDIYEKVLSSPFKGETAKVVDDRNTMLNILFDDSVN